MRDQQQGCAMLVLQAEQEIDDRLTGLLVEIAGRLVGHQNFRLGDDGACQCHALLFTARQFRRIVIRPLFEAHAAQHQAGAFKGLCLARQFERDGDIFQSGHGGDEMEGLKHHADMTAAKLRQRVLVHAGNGFAQNGDGAAVGSFQSGHTHQQRGFAGAGRPHQPHGFSFGYIKRDVFENMHAGSARPQTEIDGF